MKAKDIILIDTCVMINYMKYDIQLVRNINAIDFPVIIPLIENELIETVKNSKEMAVLQSKLSKFYMLEMHNRITKLSEKLRKLYHKTRGMDQSSSIVAATALIYDIPVYTDNYREYHFVPKLMLYTP